MNGYQDRQKTLDQEVVKLFKDTRLKHLAIVILYKGDALPGYCTPMLRSPKPKGNITLHNNLTDIYFSALEKNPSIEDGAILIQQKADEQLITGFSYRVYAPPLTVSRLENMGSGYNSALDYSGVANIICVYLINKKEVKKFIRGKEIRLY